MFCGLPCVLESLNRNWAIRRSQLSLKPFPKVVINKSRRTSFFVFDQATASSVTDLINVNVLFIWRCSLFQIRSDGLLLGLGSGGETKIPTACPMPHGVPRSFRGLRLNSLKPAELLNSTIPESESSCSALLYKKTSHFVKCFCFMWYEISWFGGQYLLYIIAVWILRTISDSHEYHPHLFGMLVLGRPQEAVVLFVSRRSLFFFFIIIEMTRNWPKGPVISFLTF